MKLYEQDGKETAAAINGYMSSDYERLWDLWRQRFPEEHLGNLGRHIHFGMDCDYLDIINHDLPELEKRAEAHLLNSVGHRAPEQELGFEHLLHPIITEHAYQLFRNGHLREAVLNSITAIFDFIRQRTGSGEEAMGVRSCNATVPETKQP